MSKILDNWRIDKDMVDGEVIFTLCHYIGGEDAWIASDAEPKTLEVAKAAQHILNSCAISLKWEGDGDGGYIAKIEGFDAVDRVLMDLCNH